MTKLYVQLLLRLFSAYKGYFFWHRINHKYDIKNSAVILLPSDKEDECASYSIKFLSACLKENQFDRALLLSNNPNIDKLIEEYEAREQLVDVIYLDDKTTESLLDFYNANMDDRRFFVASFDLPHGRNMSNYWRTNRVSKETVFAAGIYNIPLDYE